MPRFFVGFFVVTDMLFLEKIIVIENFQWVSNRGFEPYRSLYHDSSYGTSSGESGLETDFQFLKTTCIYLSFVTAKPLSRT